jgi:taurine transport system substrate-binding protein
MRERWNATVVTALGAVALLAAMTVGAPLVSAQERRVVIGHFATPAPFQAAAADGEFNRATGWAIEWRRFESSVDVLRALESGVVSIAELGSSHVALGAVRGVDFQLIGISNRIGSAEALIARNGAGISSVKDLKGKRIGVLFGSTAHYSLLGALEEAKLSSKDVTLLDMNSEQILSAWKEREIDATFIWEPARSQVLKGGRLIVGAGSIAAAQTYDGWVVNRDWAVQNADFVRAFLGVIESANARFRSNPASFAAGTPAAKSIARATGIGVDEQAPLMRGLSFPLLHEQYLWLGPGGPAGDQIAATAAFLRDNKRAEKSSASFRRFVNSDYLRAALQGR